MVGQTVQEVFLYYNLVGDVGYFIIAEYMNAFDPGSWAILDKIYCASVHQPLHPFTTYQRKWGCIDASFTR